MTQNDPTKKPKVVSTSTLPTINPKQFKTLKINPTQLKKNIESIKKSNLESKFKPQKITLPSGTILSLTDVKFTENPNQSNNVPTFDGFTIDVSGDKIKPSIQKEFALHLAGETKIDPQRLTAIKEGRVIITEGIKTTFEPTDQQVKILQAMEKQKAQEKLQGKSEWQIQRDKLDAKILQMEESKQQTQEFRNRTNEEILQNFIKVQTQKELSGDYGTNPEIPTNLNQYLTERGYDVTKPETIPTSVLKPTKLDTVEKLRSAGVAESIIKTIMNDPNANNQVQNGTTINTSVPLLKMVNFKGTGLKSQHVQSPTPTQVQTMFVPMIQHQATEPVGNPTVPINVNTDVNTKGIGGLPPTVQETTARTISNVREADKINPTLPLLAGLFILGT